MKEIKKLPYEPPFTLMAQVEMEEGFMVGAGSIISDPDKESGVSVQGQETTTPSDFETSSTISWDKDIH